jgi:DNA topoisomerase-3
MHAPIHRPDLNELLRDAFGFASFRPYQEAVCQAAASGSDVLLVMPTGAGKSLCYQLPGIARRGTTLVVSPLIALMEDQVGQLASRGFRAERIHSGRERSESRAVCREYLDGHLDFLFIAPERLKVPGFPEMLAKRKPTLIAIDEAHCISQWGHDFRPDYRMLGERLPLLRPAPVIALTATATPTVQDDIVSELRLETPLRSIHGFRRTNIGVEVVERNPSERAAIVKSLLNEPDRRPAIVYAPTRKEAEDLAKDLSKMFHAGAYHAGLRASEREDVQSAFLRGKLDVIIATTAFGMGIDKPNVRTVIHTALPATVEGYYQEIGRAGRDGEPSRAVLLQSYIDTRTHEFFFDRDYPEENVLAKIREAIPPCGVSISDLGERVGMNSQTFDKALEKLWVHGGASVDPDDTVRQALGDWRKGYEAQRAHKREALEKMRRYAETSSCRMLQLVSHFGDQNDDGTPCGMCDVCAADTCIAQLFRAPSSLEEVAALKVLAALRERDGRAIGQLHRDLFAEAGFDRRALEHVIGALARDGKIRVTSETFEKDGKTIPFQRAHLTEDGNRAVNVSGMKMLAAPERSRGKRSRKGRTATASRDTNRELTGDEAALEAALRAWRTKEAKKRGVPAFRILTNQTLLGIAVARPKDETELLDVSGIGPALLEKYGRALLSIVAG